MTKSNTIATKLPEDKAEQGPVEIGTRGTVGSLIMQEIRYFSQIESGPGYRESSQKPEFRTAGVASTNSQLKASLGSVITNPKMKKKGGTKLLPSICSMVEVSENNRPIGVSGFGYRNLKSEVKNLQRGSIQCDILGTEHWYSMGGFTVAFHFSGCFRASTINGTTTSTAACFI